MQKWGNIRKPMTLLVGRRAPEITILVGREAPEIRPVVVDSWSPASCRGPKIQPAVPDLVLVEVPKSSPLGGSGSHLDGTVVSVVHQVGRDLVFSARGHVALSLY